VSSTPDPGRMRYPRREYHLSKGIRCAPEAWVDIFSLETRYNPLESPQYHLNDPHARDIALTHPPSLAPNKQANKHKDRQETMSRIPNNSVNGSESHAALLSSTTQPCMQTNTEYRRSSAVFAQTFNAAAAHVKSQMASEEDVSRQRRDSACDSSEASMEREFVPR
jgi:hypothetical protein